MRTALLIGWWLAGGLFGVQLLLAAVAGLAPILVRASVGNVNLGGDALFFSALLGLPLALGALLLLALGLAGWLRQPVQARSFFARSTACAAALLVASIAWLVANAGLFGGGIIH